MARHGFPMARCGGRDLPRAGMLSSAKASRHGARAKGFAPRRNAPTAKASRHGARAKGFARARTLPSAKASRHGARAKGFARAGTRPSAKASRHGARAKGFAPRRDAPSAKASRHGARAKGFAPREKALLGEGLPTRRASERICPAGVRPRPTCRRTAGRPRSTDSQKNTPSAGSHPQRAAAAEFIHLKK